ncbi:MAG: hypothetical protein N3D11_14520 [Candidatus Sumerlaeia bacterium]|nr:hypothetical protein [Candidatus Sumerlaeia bacterium]
MRIEKQLQRGPCGVRGLARSLYVLSLFLPFAPAIVSAANVRVEECMETFPDGVQLTRPSQLPQPQATTILYDTFEGTWPGTGWSVSGNPTWDDTTCDNPPPYAGSKSIWCCRGGSLGRDPNQYYYANNMTAWAIYGPFSLADATSGTFSFHLWNQSEINYDWFKYMVSVNGTQFYGYQTSGDTGGWVWRSIDFATVPTLGNVLGRSQVWVGLLFTSDGSNVDDGAFVDELRIEKTVSTAQWDLFPLDVYPGDGAGNELPKPYNIAQGQSIRLCMRYQCTGTGQTPAFRVEIFLDGQSRGWTDVTITGGQTATYIGPAWTATVGSHSLEGRVDTTNTVPETNESNNTRTEAACFTVTGIPDIRIAPTQLNFTVPLGSTVAETAKPIEHSAPPAATDLRRALATSDGRRLVWLTPDDKADAVALAKTLRAMGGSVLTLAPEGRLLVAVEAAKTTSLASLAGVAKAEPHVVEDAGGDPNVAAVPGLGDRPPTPEEKEYIEQVTKPAGAIEPNDLARARAALQDSGKLALADNSLSQFFPPIRSQGSQGSCTAWASCYYYNTYTQARDENLTVSGGDNTKICSPAFMYALVNDGQDNGAPTPAVVARLSEVGACSWSLMPYNQNDYLRWPTEAAWIDALKRRTSTVRTLSLTSDAGIAALKQLLANGNIAVTRTTAYANWHPTFSDNAGRGIQNGVLFSHTGEADHGGHAMTFVGFDDNRAYNDGTTTRYGAFLVANSWGNTWGTYNSSGTGSKGFMWVAYDYVKAANGCFIEAFYNDDRDDYRPRLYAAAGLNHPQRGHVTYWGGIGPPATPAWNSYKPIDRAGGTLLALAATTGTQSMRVACDLTDGIPQITDYTNVQAFVKFQVSSFAAANGTISSADFFHDFDGDGNFTKVTSTDPTVTVPPNQTGSARVAFNAQGGSLSQSFTIYNDGNDTLRVTGIARRDGDMWVSWSPNPTAASPLTIAPGQSSIINVLVNPTQCPLGVNEEQLVVSSNDPNENPYPGGVLVITQKGGASGAARWEMYR